MVQQLDEQELRIQPADPVAVRAAKVAIKAGRRLQREDDPALVHVITSAVAEPASPPPGEKQDEMLVGDNRGSRKGHDVTGPGRP